MVRKVIEVTADVYARFNQDQDFCDMVCDLTEVVGNTKKYGFNRKDYEDALSVALATHAKE